MLKTKYQSGKRILFKTIVYEQSIQNLPEEYIILRYIIRITIEKKKKRIKYPIVTLYVYAKIRFTSAYVIRLNNILLFWSGLWTYLKFSDFFFILIFILYLRVFSKFPTYGSPGRFPVRLLAATTRRIIFQCRRHVKRIASVVGLDSGTAKSYYIRTYSRIPTVNWLALCAVDEGQ